MAAYITPGRINLGSTDNAVDGILLAHREQALPAKTDATAPPDRCVPWRDDWARSASPGGEGRRRRGREADRGRRLLHRRSSAMSRPLI